MSEKLSKWLAKELESRGWSHRELGRRAGVSQTAVSQAISQGRGIGWDFCAKIAKPLGASPEKVFRLAGLMPALPDSEDGAILKEILDVVKRLPEEEKEDVLSYLKWYTDRQQGKKKPPKTTPITAPKSAPLIEHVPQVSPDIPPMTRAKVRALVERLTPDERANLIDHLLSRRDFVEALKSRGVEVRPQHRRQIQEASNRKDQE